MDKRREKSIIDQAKTLNTMAGVAQFTKSIYDAFHGAGFTELQAMQLTKQWLSELVQKSKGKQHGTGNI